MWPALTVAHTERERETERYKCVCGGCLRSSLHLHVKWPGCDTAGKWSAAGENKGRFPGQCYVTSSITALRSSV